MSKRYLKDLLFYLVLYGGWTYLIGTFTGSPV